MIINSNELNNSKEIKGVVKRDGNLFEGYSGV